MSHCGLCGTYINDPHDDWYRCAECVEEYGNYPEERTKVRVPGVLEYIKLRLEELR